MCDSVCVSVLTHVTHGSCEGRFVTCSRQKNRTVAKGGPWAFLPFPTEPTPAVGLLWRREAPLRPTGPGLGPWSLPQLSTGGGGLSLMWNFTEHCSGVARVGGNESLAPKT